MPNQMIERVQKKTHLGDAIAEILRDHEMSQNQFSVLAGFDPSKSSRIIRGEIACDAQTVDSMLNVFEDRTTKFKLVAAFVQDATGPESRKHFMLVPPSGKRPKQLDASALSEDCASALQYILERAAEGHDVEGLFKDFARAIGWRPGRGQVSSVKTERLGTEQPSAGSAPAGANLLLRTAEAAAGRKLKPSPKPFSKP